MSACWDGSGKAAGRENLAEAALSQRGQTARTGVPQESQEVVLPAVEFQEVPAVI